VIEEFIKSNLKNKCAYACKCGYLEEMTNLKDVASDDEQEQEKEKEQEEQEEGNEDDEEDEGDRGSSDTNYIWNFMICMVWILAGNKWFLIGASLLTDIHKVHQGMAALYPPQCLAYTLVHNSWKFTTRSMKSDDESTTWSGWISAIFPL